MAAAKRHAIINKNKIVRYQSFPLPNFESILAQLFVFLITMFLTKSILYNQLCKRENFKIIYTVQNYLNKLKYIVKSIYLQ